MVPYVFRDWVKDLLIPENESLSSDFIYWKDSKSEDLVGNDNLEHHRLYDVFDYEDEFGNVHEAVVDHYLFRLLFKEYKEEAIM